MVNDKNTTDKQYSVEEVESVVAEKVKQITQDEETKKAFAELEDFTKEITAKVETLEKSDQEKEETIEALRTVISEKEEALEKTGEEISKLQEELENTQSKLEASEKEITEAKEKEMLADRVNILADKDLLRSNEENQIKQIEKVRTMSDDDFSAHVEELEDIKNKTLASFQAEAAKEDDKSSETGEPSKDTEHVQVEAEKVAAKKISEELEDASDNEMAEDLIKDLLARVSKKSTANTADKAEDADDKDSNGEKNSETKTDPKNFESAAVTNPGRATYSSLSTGFVERLCK